MTCLAPDVLSNSQDWRQLLLVAHACTRAAEDAAREWLGAVPLLALPRTVLPLPALLLWPIIALFAATAAATAAFWSATLSSGWPESRAPVGLAFPIDAISCCCVCRIFSARITSRRYSFSWRSRHVRRSICASRSAHSRCCEAVSPGGVLGGDGDASLCGARLVYFFLLVSYR